MTFTSIQVDSLSAPLTTDKVKTNPRGFDYVEGWHAIAEANRIFGFGEWDRTVCELRQLGEPREVDGKQRVGYMARVRITVRANGETVTRDGCGYGSGIDRDLGQAHESALKEAETDAMKRALMTFGNPFGLALYDKARENVAAPDLPRKPLWVVSAKAAIECLNTQPECDGWYKANLAMLKGQPKDERDEVLSYLKARKTSLAPLPAETAKPATYGAVKNGSARPPADDPFSDEIPF